MHYNLKKNERLIFGEITFHISRYLTPEMSVFYGIFNFQSPVFKYRKFYPMEWKNERQILQQKITGQNNQEF